MGEVMSDPIKQRREHVMSEATGGRTFCVFPLLAVYFVAAGCGTAARPGVLMSAARAGDPAAVKLELGVARQTGAVFDDAALQDALVVAIYQKNAEMTRVLLDAGANSDRGDPSPLRRALIRIANGKEPKVETLLAEIGHHCRLPDDSLDLAVGRRDQRLLVASISAGADPSRKFKLRIRAARLREREDGDRLQA